MDKYSENLQKQNTKVMAIYKQFKIDEMSGTSFESWIAELVREMFSYQIAKHQPKKDDT